MELDSGVYSLCPWLVADLNEPEHSALQVSEKDYIFFFSKNQRERERERKKC
jgi:hypothetical protein